MRYGAEQAQKDARKKAGGRLVGTSSTGTFSSISRPLLCLSPLLTSTYAIDLDLRPPTSTQANLQLLRPQYLRVSPLPCLSLPLEANSARDSEDSEFAASAVVMKAFDKNMSWAPRRPAYA
ncbi:hypothetical protein G7Y89_g2943 [Cudoniella acicularis]|uniref:Uncharacterized protein n=1 Tax=Cudoniella acicularis TaxID=354080 RepID=A0A8H4RVB9_9HELO|nr:hypothetical protein G7Y89_g2943 [Cudoniella acicularis]